jgi:hypothetical protein
MSPGDGSEPIEDDEILLRRIPIALFDATSDPKPSAEAFHPMPYDATGISVSRRKYISAEEVARNPRGKSYYVALLRMTDLRAEGIRVEPRPTADNPGHAEFPEIRYDNRKSVEVEQWKVALATRVCLGVLGPFPGA